MTKDEIKNEFFKLYHLPHYGHPTKDCVWEFFEKHLDHASLSLPSDEQIEKQFPEGVDENGRRDYDCYRRREGAKWIRDFKGSQENVDSVCFIDKHHGEQAQEGKEPHECHYPHCQCTSVCPPVNRYSKEYIHSLQSQVSTLVEALEKIDKMATLAQAQKYVHDVIKVYYKK